MRLELIREELCASYGNNNNNSNNKYNKVCILLLGFLALNVKVKIFRFYVFSRPFKNLILSVESDKDLNYLEF